MRICLYIGSMSLGGIGKLMLHLMQEFQKRNIEVDLFLMKGGGEYMSQVPLGVRVFIVQGSYFRRVIKFINYLNAERPDVSISARPRQDVGNIIGTMLSVSKTKPVISVHTNVSIENQLDKSRKQNSKLYNWFSNLLYKYPKKFIAVSSGVADDFSRRTGIARESIKVIYNAAYVPYIESVPDNIPTSYQQLLFSNTEYIIGVGRLTFAKDFETLIRSYKIVSKKTKLSLVILGEGPLRTSLEKLVFELGLQGKVLFLGYVHDPLYYIKKAKVFVMSSRWEGFGNVLVEALGVGTPVVSTDCESGPREILEGGTYGKLVPVGDIDALADAILRCLKTKNDSALLIERAQEFSADRIANQYLEYIFND